MFTMLFSWLGPDQWLAGLEVKPCHHWDPRKRRRYVTFCVHIDVFFCAVHFCLRDYTFQMRTHWKIPVRFAVPSLSFHRFFFFYSSSIFFSSSQQAYVRSEHSIGRFSAHLCGFPFSRGCWCQRKRAQRGNTCWSMVMFCLVVIPHDKCWMLLMQMKPINAIN